MAKKTARADGRYQSKIYLPGGKYKYVYASTPTELKEKITIEKARQQKGIDITAANDTFCEWAEMWLKIKETEVSHNRFVACRCRRRNLAMLDGLKIARIRTIDVQNALIDLQRAGMSCASLKDIKSAAVQIMQLAADNMVIDNNPAHAAKIPKAAAKKVIERRALTADEQQWIVTTKHRGQRAAMIMMYAGLRRGELIPLLWSDVDLINKTIAVNKAVEMIDGQSVIKDTTKTPAGMRTVYIPQVLADFLAELDHQGSMYVCPSASGGMMSERGYLRLWESYFKHLNYEHGNFTNVMVNDKATGKLKQYVKPDKFEGRHEAIPVVIPPITAHWLRHTFVTLMYLAGIDVVTAQKQAGHADIQTTLNIYTHLDDEYKAKQVTKLDDYLNPPQIDIIAK